MAFPHGFSLPYMIAESICHRFSSMHSFEDGLPIAYMTISNIKGFDGSFLGRG